MRRWTVEERHKQALAIRGWKPWLHSTGAKTDAGKTVSKMNAYKHGARGVLSREIIRLVAEYSDLLAKVDF